MPEIKRILIANRGEIAVRICRTAKELGKEVITVYSPQDKGGIWRFISDESYEIRSYLDIDEIIQVAKRAKADAIHPGYGFLSEREEFASECERAGIKFIGPNPGALHMSGDKAVAREKAHEAGVPIVPGSHATSSPDEALKIAKDIGFPVLLKAAGGGGGKGMRPVHSEEDFQHLFKQASEEAKAAFGDPRIYVEKYIKEPKHIEIQILADEHGNYIYLFERDCSLQRRNQKVIEESPSPKLPENIRLKMCESAVKIMKKIGYTNAGTVEFIVDRDWKFYFIEINARIQVEHPVTELVTGIDLIKRQIKIAEGKKLDIAQENIKIQGHAMELRIYAEDPDNDFMPSGGKITFYREPSIPGIRCDGWLYPGCEVPSQYDPMLLKLIAKEETRDNVIDKIIVALDELKIQGIKNNIPFFRFVLKHPDFRKGDINTWSMSKILEDYKKWRDEEDKISDALLIVGAYLTSNRKPTGISHAEINEGPQNHQQKTWKFSSWKHFGRTQPRLK